MNNDDTNIKIGVELDAKISDVQKQLDVITKNIKANTTLAVDYTKSKSEIQKQTADIAKYIQTEFNKIAKGLNLPELTNKDSLKYAKDYVNQYVKIQELQAKTDNSKRIQEEKELVSLKKEQFEYEQKRKQSLKEGKNQSDEYKYQQSLNQAYKEADENILREKEYLAQRNALLAEGNVQAKEYANIQAKTDNINTKISNGQVTKDVSTVGKSYSSLNTIPDSLKADYQTLLALSEKLNTSMSNEEKNAVWDQYLAKLTSVKNKISAVNATTEKFVSEQKKLSTADSLSQWITNNSKATKMLGGEINGMLAKLRSGAVMTDAEFKQLNTRITEMKLSARDAGKLGFSFGDKIKNVWQKFGGWSLATGAMMSAFQEVKEGVKFIGDLDAALTDVVYTTDITKTKLADLGNSAIDMAKDYKTSANTVLEVIKIYSTANSTAEEMLRKSKSAIMLSNVSGMSGSESAKTINTALNQFELEDTSKNLNDIVDTLEYVSSQLNYDFTDGINEINEGIEASGNTAKNAGLNMQEYAAMVGLAVEKTGQSGSTVGNAYKTIFSRITKASKIEATPDEDISNAEESLRSVGIQVRDTEDEFRDLTDIMNDLGEKWSSLSSVQKSNIGFEVAGTRQLNILNSLFGSWNKYKDIISDIDNRSGMAEKNQEKYADSIQGKLKGLEAEGKSAWNGIINSDEIKVGIDAVSGLISVLGNLGSVLGKMPTGASLGAITSLIMSLTGHGAVQYNSDTGGVTTWLSGLRNGIANVNKEADDFFTKYKKNGKDLSKSITNSMGVNGGFDDFIKSSKLADENLIEFLGDTKYGTKDLASYKQYLVDTGETTSLFSSLTQKAGGALKTLGAAMGSMAIMWAAGAAISAVVTAIDNYIHRVENAKEAIETIQTSINDTNNVYKSHADLVSSVSARYQELSKGVNAVNNKNISLSDEDYTEFLDITNQLADAFPELQRTLDANGNSVLKFSNNSKSATENLKDLLKAEQESTQIEVASHVDELFENLRIVIDNATDSQEEYNKQLTETEERIERVNSLKNISDKTGVIDLSLDTTDADNSTLHNVIQDGITKLRNEFKGEELVLFNESLTNQSETDGTQTIKINTNMPGMTDEMKQKIQSGMKEAVDYFNSDILPKMNDDLSEAFDKNKKVQDDMTLKWLDFIPSAIAKMKSMPSFQSIGDELGEQITTIFSNLDASTLNDIDASGGFEDYIYQLIGYVNTDRNKQEFQNAFKELTSIDPSDSSSLNKQKIDRYSHQIAAILHEDVDKIKLAFGFDDEAIKKNTEQAVQVATDTAKTTISSTIDELNTNYKPAFDALQKAYQNIFTYDDKGKRQFSLENFDLSAIDSIKSAMGSMKDAGLDVSTKAFNNLVSTLSDSTSTADDVQKSFNKMSTSIASNLDNINSSNAGLVESFLESSGVTNAHEVVQNQLIATQEKNKNSTQALATATNDMADGVWDSSNAFLEEANMTDLAKSQLADLIATEKIFGNTALNLDDKIQQLNNLANAYLGVKNVISTPSGMGTDSRYGITEESIQKQWNKALKKNNTQLKFDGISEPKSSSSSKSDKTKTTSEIFDFIEKKLDRLQTKLDKFKAKAEDTTRTTKARLGSYDDTSDQTKANITANEKAYKIYMKKADSAGKKGKGTDLSDSWINKIQNGSYDINDVKDDKLKTKIENYQKWYDKAKKTKDTIDTLKKSEDELAKGKIETQIKGYEETADKIADANEKIKNSIETKGTANSSDYAQMNNNILSQIDSIYQQIDAEKELQNNYKKGSEEYDIYASKIRDLKGDVDNLTASMKANAEASANLINEQADKYRDKLNSDRELLDAQIANANGSGAKNNLLNGKLGNVKYQKSINSWAVSSNADYLSSKGKDLANTDLSSYVNSNQLIPPEVLATITDKTLYDKCVNYNAALNAYNTSVATEKLYNETSKKDTNDIGKEQFDNVTADFESRLANNDEEVRKKQAEIDKREAMGLGQSKRQYEEQIAISKRRQEDLEREKQEQTDLRDGMMVTNQISQETYDAMTETINGVDSSIDDCVVDQIKYNSAIEDMDLSNLEAIGELLDIALSKYDKLKSLAEKHGNKVSDKQIFDQIDMYSTDTNNLKDANSNLYDQMKQDMKTAGLDESKFAEFLKIVQSGSSEATIDKYLENNNVDSDYGGLTDFRGHYKSYADNESNIIDNEIAQETLFDDAYQNRIDMINEYLEKLQKEKDVKDKIFALEEARFNLDKAKNNLTKKVWNGEQWVYTSDKEAVKSAQKGLDDTVYSQYVDALNDNTEALKQAQKDKNMYDDNGNQIMTLDDIASSVTWADKLVPIQDDFKDWINKFDIGDIGKNINVSIPDYSSMLANGNAVGNTYHFDKLAIECPNITDSSTEEKIYKVLDDVARDLSSYATQQNHIN